MAIQLKRISSTPTAEQLKTLVNGQPVIDLTTGDLYVGGCDKKVGQSLVESEALVRNQADTALEGKIQTEISTRQTAITNEIQNRESADSTLQTAINTEANAREEFDNAHNNIENGVESASVQQKDFVYTGESFVFSDTTKGTQNGDMVPGAIASGIGSVALGGLRYDYYTSPETHEYNLTIDPTATENWDRTPTSAEGNQSFAAGGSVHAYGNWSVALCKDTKSYQRGSFAAGGSSIAGDPEGSADEDCYSAAFGDSNKAYGRRCFCANGENTIRGTDNTGFGTKNTTAKSVTSTLVSGKHNQIHGGDNNIISGYNNRAYVSYNSAIFGSSNKIGNALKNSLVCGYNSDEVCGDTLIILGEGLKATNKKNQTILGKYNTEVDDALFIIGNGSDKDNRENSIEVLYGGGINLNILNNSGNPSLKVKSETSGDILEVSHSGAALCYKEPSEEKSILRLGDMMKVYRSPLSAFCTPQGIPGSVNMDISFPVWDVNEGRYKSTVVNHVLPDSASFDIYFAEQGSYNWVSWLEIPVTLSCRIEDNNYKGEWNGESATNVRIDLYFDTSDTLNPKLTGSIVPGSFDGRITMINDSLFDAPEIDRVGLSFLDEKIEGLIGYAEGEYRKFNVIFNNVDINVYLTNPVLQATSDGWKLTADHEATTGTSFAFISNKKELPFPW